MAAPLSRRADCSSARGPAMRKFAPSTKRQARSYGPANYHGLVALRQRRIPSMAANLWSSRPPAISSVSKASMAMRTSLLLCRKRSDTILFMQKGRSQKPPALALAALSFCAQIFAHAASPRFREYRDFAMGHEGDPGRGREIFFSENSAACIKCHSVDGSASKAGPDLLAVGDKFPRDDMIRAVLEPSIEIAIGYGATTIETKSDESHTGIIKESSDEWVSLIEGNGQWVRIARKDVEAERPCKVSLMPDGLEAGMSLQQFTDLIEYIVNLKQPENALTSNRGMPATIPELARPIALRPFFSEDLRFPHAFVQKAGDVRSGLVWFGQIPEGSNLFLAVHQTGKIWLLEKQQTNVTKTFFAGISKDIFNERGPNGLLGLAFHPKFRQNLKYYLKHQVFEEGRIVT